MQKEYMKAANLSYERSMLDLSVKQGDGGAVQQQKTGKKTNFDKTRAEPKYTRMKKKVNQDSYKDGQRVKNQQRKPFY